MKDFINFQRYFSLASTLPFQARAWDHYWKHSQFNQKQVVLGFLEEPDSSSEVPLKVL